MTLGNKLIGLRKKIGLSQEEVAEKLGVTRQTVSKWETDQSTPDFDKIGPLCELFGISADELLMGKEKNKETSNLNESMDSTKKKKQARGIGFGVILYFVAIAWIMISIPVLKMNPIIASAIFLVMCGIATFFIIYSAIVYKTKKKPEEVRKQTVVQQIDNVLSLVTLVIYLSVSFLTMAWAVTWVIWIIYAAVIEIIKLAFMLKDKENEK